MKLYDLYTVISNKTVRKNEKYYKKYRGSQSAPGTMIKTNRGYFIDGHNVDQKSVDLWFSLVKKSKKK